jgi:Protein of unknown function (DUF3866)
MIRIRPGEVVRAIERHAGLVELEVEVGGGVERALAYPALTGPVAEGDRVALNTTAVASGLGTGGYHFVMAVLRPVDLDPSSEGHVMKLRYTPVQAQVRAVEEQGSPDHGRIAEAEGLDGLPVVWIPLHSMLAPVVAGARAAGAERIVYAMTDGAALPAWYSDQAARLREAELLDAVITCGQALGGDVEAVNVFSGLLAGAVVRRADVVVVGDGPGKVGTSTRWGASDVASGMALNAAGILGGRPVAALRVNFADPRYRHHAVSPHSITVLRDVALVPVHVAVPSLPDEDRRGAVWEALKEARLEERHQLVEVSGEPAVDLLRARGIPAETMGRSLDEEPAFFLAAGAAGVLAGRMADGTARWRGEAEG